MASSHEENPTVLPGLPRRPSTAGNPVSSLLRQHIFAPASTPHQCALSANPLVPTKPTSARCPRIGSAGSRPGCRSSEASLQPEDFERMPPIDSEVPFERHRSGSPSPMDEVLFERQRSGSPSPMDEVLFQRQPSPTSPHNEGGFQRQQSGSTRCSSSASNSSSESERDVTAPMAPRERSCSLYKARRENKRKNRQTRPPHPSKFLSKLPEIDDIRFRYTFLLAGLAAERVREGFPVPAEHRGQEEERTQKSVSLGTAPLKVLCRVHGGADLDEPASPRSSGNLAQVQVYTYSKVSDVIRPFATAMDASNAVSVFVLQVNTGEKELKQQMQVLNVFAAQHCWAPKPQRSALSVLLLVGDEAAFTANEPLPQVVEDFSRRYCDLRKFCLTGDSGVNGPQLLGLVVELATELGKAVQSDAECSA